MNAPNTTTTHQDHKSWKESQKKFLKITPPPVLTRGLATAAAAVLPLLATAAPRIFG